MADQSSERLECKVCYFPYDAQHRVPHSVRCGLTFCRICFLQIIRVRKRTTVICPLCKRVTRLDLQKEGLGLPINHALIEAMGILERYNVVQVDDDIAPELLVPSPDERVPKQLRRLPYFQPAPDFPIEEPDVEREPEAIRRFPTANHGMTQLEVALRNPLAVSDVLLNHIQSALNNLRVGLNNAQQTRRPQETAPRTFHLRENVPHRRPRVNQLEQRRGDDQRYHQLGSSRRF